MIYITGDTHGDYDLEKITTRIWSAQRKLTRADYLIICGDFGAIWNGDRKDEYRLKWHDEKPYTTLWVDGNHENFDALNQYPVQEWHGGKVQFVKPNVIHLMRGQIYDINGKSFFTFGGGMSYDKEWRKEGQSWWSQEVSKESEMAEAWQNLESRKFNVDYIITHAAPQSVIKAEISNCNRAKIDYDCPCERFLDIVMKEVAYQEWFCGHYHMDMYLERKRIRVLYNRIWNLNQHCLE